MWLEKQTIQIDNLKIMFLMFPNAYKPMVSHINLENKNKKKNHFLGFDLIHFSTKFATKFLIINKYLIYIIN